MPPIVNWNKRASQNFRRIYSQILKESLDNAEMVRDGITEIVDSLPFNPTRYPLDKYKSNNPGNYRAFERYSYRISYRHTDKEIRILRIRHVKQEPKNY